MRPVDLTAALAVALGAALTAGRAPAQEVARLPGGWTLHRKIAASPNAVACGGSRAFIRDWSGRVTVLNKDGGWSPLPPIPGSQEGRTYGRTLAASPRTDELFVEASGRIAHWDGRGWSLLELPGWQGPIGALAALPSGDLVVAGRGRIGLRQGRAISSYDAGTWRELNAIAGTSLTDLWTAGQGGTVMRRDQGGWQRMATGSDAWLGGLLVAAGGAWAWTVAPGRGRRGVQDAVLRFDGARWSPVTKRLPGRVVGLAGDAHQPWAAGDSFVARFDGSAWGVQLQAADLGDGYHSLVGICTTDKVVVIADSGGHALSRPRGP